MAEAPDTDPAPAQDRIIAWATAGLVAATVLVGALAPAAHGPERAPPHASNPLSPADDPACAEWTDGCRVCQRLPDGPACSMPGIACTQRAPECLRGP